MRPLSTIAPQWWDYTTLDSRLLKDALVLSEKDLQQLSRPGFEIVFYDDLKLFFLAEAMEYINCWKKSSATNPKGICGPIGPTEQLPLVAQIVNELEIDIKEGHFWAMDEWYMDGKEMPTSNPLSFTKTDLDLCFNHIRKDLRMPDENLHFLKADNLKEYTQSYDQAQCLIMQGGQGEVKHWAFNDPLPREGNYKNVPPSPEEYLKLSARLIDLHPLTVIQNARTSGKGAIFTVPSQALSVGPLETWKTKKISIWHTGTHDNPYGIRLTSLMISKKIADSSVPMSLLSGHSDVQFNIYRPAVASCMPEIH